MSCVGLLLFLVGLSGLANCPVLFPIGILWGLPMMVVGFGPLLALAIGGAKK